MVAFEERHPGDGRQDPVLESDERGPHSADVGKFGSLPDVDLEPLLFRVLVYVVKGMSEGVHVDHLRDKLHGLLSVFLKKKLAGATKLGHNYNYRTLQLGRSFPFRSPFLQP